MDIHLISEQRVEEYKAFALSRVIDYPWITPSAITLKSFYQGFTEFKFTDAKAIAEKTKQVYLTHNTRKNGNIED